MKKVLMKGNEAVAEAAIMAGCRHYFGYPITPQNEIGAYMSARMPKIGGVFLQAESEISAINMVYGAAGAGKRVMTSSSSPGISLKTEGISYLCGADLPCVIVNIQRGGPGLGTIQPSQADYFQCVKGGGHGDYKTIVFAPSSVQEMADLAVEGFSAAEKYRMPVMILSDGTLGQMMEPVALKYPAPKLPTSDWAATGTQGKRKPNVINSLFLLCEQLESAVVSRFERYKTVVQNETRVEEYQTEDADICIVAFGISARVGRGAVNLARAQGLKVGLIRPITLWPFPSSTIEKAAQKVKAFLTVECSMGQMVEDVRLATAGKKPVHFFGKAGGTIPSPEQVLAEIIKIGGVK
ncbi:MAG: 3-methyl-2-oxobutanoate dehydrogenase subunit VorB [Firmicutes bacterium]|nr:3-methyl-2-oxobutanoate dehydrogenase subunit VorB [Bacillota bacterium]